jgi:hypothetical protein
MGTACGAIIFAVAAVTTISYSLGRQYRPVLSLSLSDVNNNYKHFCRKNFPNGVILGANFVKLFLSVIYEFSHKDRVLVRICSKNLPRSNTISYYKSSLITDKKVL